MAILHALSNTAALVIFYPYSVTFDLTSLNTNPTNAGPNINSGYQYPTAHSLAHRVLSQSCFES